MDDVTKVEMNISAIYAKKKLMVLALCKYYARLVIKDFKEQQEDNKYWTNRTGFAKDLMFARSFTEDNVVGFFMAHTVSYGPTLELGHDKKYAAIKPTMDKFVPNFMKDLKRLW